MKKNKQNTDEVATLKAQLAQAQAEAATYRQQPDSITSQMQDLDAKAGIEMNRLRAIIEKLQAQLPKVETGGAFGGAKK